MAKLKPKGGPDEIDVYVGARLRELRLEHGTDQETMGKALDICPNQIQKYETGKNRISAGKLWKASKFLKVSVLAFFPGWQPVK